MILENPAFLSPTAFSLQIFCFLTFGHFFAAVVQTCGRRAADVQQTCRRAADVQQTCSRRAEGQDYRHYFVSFLKDRTLAISKFPNIVFFVAGRLTFIDFLFLVCFSLFFDPAAHLGGRFTSFWRNFGHLLAPFGPPEHPGAPPGPPRGPRGRF